MLCILFFLQPEKDWVWIVFSSSEISCLAANISLSSTIPSLFKSNGSYCCSSTVGFILENAKFAAITKEIASGSNTNMITKSSTFIILSIAIPVKPERYLSGPNSPAISLPVLISTISVSYSKS